MIVNSKILLASNPFIDAYVLSDFLGKLIFIGLVILSIATWILIIYHVRIMSIAREQSIKFYESFMMQKSNLLNIEYASQINSRKNNPFLELYTVLKKQTVDILNKNRQFGHVENALRPHKAAYLSPSDISVINAYLSTTIATQINKLEKYLYLLSTIVGLAPFLGLLGTVWGILTTFSQMQAQTGGGASQMVLGGLSLALATTVIGLIDAIPAQIGYNYLKQAIKNYEIEMEQFSTEILATVEIQYRRVEIS